MRCPAVPPAPAAGSIAILIRAPTGTGISTCSSSTTIGIVSSPIASADPRRNGRWQIGAGYRHALEWSQHVRWPYVEEEYHPAPSCAERTCRLIGAFANGRHQAIAV